MPKFVTDKYGQIVYRGFHHGMNWSLIVCQEL